MPRVIKTCTILSVRRRTSRVRSSCALLHRRLFFRGVLSFVVVVYVVVVCALELFFFFFFFFFFFSLKVLSSSAYFFLFKSGVKIGQKKVTHLPRFACHRAPVQPRDGVAVVRRRTLGGVFFVVDDVVWSLAARGGRWKDIIDFARTG